MLLVVLLYALFASIFSLSKIALDASEPYFFIGSRMLFAGLVMVVVQLFRDRASLRINKSQFLSLFFLGLTATYITNIAEIWALNHTGSAKVCLLYSLSPFASAFIAYVVLKEKLNKAKWIGLLIGMLGLIPVTYIQTQTEISEGTLFSFSKAELVMLIAVFASVYGWILLKKVLQNYNTSFITANGVSMSIGGSLALLHSFLSGETWQPLPISDVPAFLKGALLICLISNFICYNLYGYLLKKFSATFMSFAGLVTPLFAALFGHYFLEEQISWHYYLALGIFGIGLSLFYKEELLAQKKIQTYT
ncbi:MAG: DMT family transporter [Gammaproteobacteria bacterium]